MGHIKDLPPKEMGVDIPNSFQPVYTWLKGKKSAFQKIKASAKLANEIFIGTDPDREGEFIAYQIHAELSSMKKPIYRTRFFEITKQHIKDSISARSDISQPLVESQMARRIIDRLYGYLVSPRLWKELKISNLSAGRVQSTVLQWICDRESEIREFIPEPYAILSAIVSSPSDLEIPVIYKSPKDDYLKKEEALQVLKAFGMSGSGVVQTPTKLQYAEFKEKPYRQLPPKPFTTASLQESASRQLGLSPSDTLKIAKSLYEGIEIPGKGLQGLITYIRTDSTRVSPEKMELGKQTLLNLGFSRFHSLSNRKSKSNAFAQEAHEALVPIDPRLTPDQIKSSLSKSEYNLYLLIWKRFLQSLLPEEKGTTLERSFLGKGHRFQHSYLLISDSGYTALGKTEKSNEDPFAKIKIGEEVSVARWELEEKKTKPPIRYTEGALVQKMEVSGIGRPSTYATVLQTLVKRKYIRIEKKNIVVNSLGEKVNSFVSLQIPDLLGSSFTKEMEEDLDSIANQRKEKQSVLTAFYFALQKALAQKLEKPQGNQQKRTAFVPKCPVCQTGEIRKKTGKKGNVISYCSRYPHCDYVEATID